MNDDEDFPLTDIEVLLARDLLAEYGFEKTPCEIENDEKIIEPLIKWKEKINSIRPNLEQMALLVAKQDGLINDYFRELLELQVGSLNDMEYQTWVDMIIIFL